MTYKIRYLFITPLAGPPCPEGMSCDFCSPDIPVFAICTKPEAVREELAEALDTGRTNRSRPDGVDGTKR